MIKCKAKDTDLSIINGFPLELSERRYQKINGWLETLPAKKKLADIGCGDGELTRYFTHDFDDVYGVDISLKCLDLINKNFPSIITVNAQAGVLPFADESMDALVLYSVSQHIS